MKVICSMIVVACSLIAQDVRDPLAVRARSMVKRAIEENGAWKALDSLIRHAPKRLSGSPGAAAAVEWGRQRMLALGLGNVRLEEVMVPRWVRGSTCTVDVVGSRSSAGSRLASTALGGSIGTPPRGIEAEVVEVRSVKGLRALGKKGITGRIVFFNQPFDNTQKTTGAGYGAAVWQRTQGAVLAGMRGAVAVLVRSVTSARDDVPHTGAMGYKDGVQRIPAAAISVAAAERLHGLLANEGPVRVRLRMNCHTLPDVPSANVVGELPGTLHPDEIVLIGAHLDAWDLAQGAHDDGAGVAHVLEAARLIRTSGPPPARTVRVGLFMNEENGLRGGKGYAKAHAMEARRHVAALETDSGGFSPVSIGVSPGKHLLAAMAPLGALLEANALGTLTPGGGGADIGPLRAHGVPLLGLRVASDRYFDFHHSARDTLDKVHPRELARGAAAVAITALWVADHETALRTLIPSSTR